VRKDGHSLGVWVSHAMIDGDVWVTTTTNRPKTKAWRKDPRMSAIFGVAGKGAVTIVGRIEITEDPAMRTKFLTALADNMKLTGDQRRLWFVHMDTEGRIVGKIVPDKYITFDERKLEW